MGYLFISAWSIQNCFHGIYYFKTDIFPFFVTIQPKNKVVGSSCLLYKQYYSLFACLFCTCLCLLVCKQLLSCLKGKNPSNTLNHNSYVYQIWCFQFCEPIFRKVRKGTWFQPLMVLIDGYITLIVIVCKLCK